MKKNFKNIKIFISSKNHFDKFILNYENLFLIKKFFLELCNKYKSKFSYIIKN